MPSAVPKIPYMGINRTHEPIIAIKDIIEIIAWVCTYFVPISVLFAGTTMILQSMPMHKICIVGDAIV